MNLKTLYLDCGMGAAGDMLAAALLELLPEPEAFMAEMNALGIPCVTVSRSESVKCGIRGTRFSVSVNGMEEDGCEVHASVHGSGMEKIAELVAALPVSARVREDVLAVYRLIADAESRVHGCPVSQVHFHEVGAIDAVTDITAVCMLMEKLAPARVVVSPVCVGSGQVKCSHGILPVPAPATALLLHGMPFFGGDVAGEMCTPTGAALLRYFATDFGTMPVMRAGEIGYGLGSRDYGVANCVRAFHGGTEIGRDVVSELKCNLDDMTPEALGFVQGLLFENGALDVYTVQVGMKKSRPGIQLCCMCREEDTDGMIGILFKHTTTIGLRVSREERYVLNRSIDVVQTEYGPIRVKKAGLGGLEK
jgi:uncharacterized protein (TIGR00299 family) protein